MEPPGPAEGRRRWLHAGYETFAGMTLENWKAFRKLLPSA